MIAREEPSDPRRPALTRGAPRSRCSTSAPTRRARGSTRSSASSGRRSIGSRSRGRSIRRWRHGSQRSPGPWVRSPSSSRLLRRHPPLATEHTAARAAAFEGSLAEAANRLSALEQERDQAAAHAEATGAAWSQEREWVRSQLDALAHAHADAAKTSEAFRPALEALTARLDALEVGSRVRDVRDRAGVGCARRGT